MELLMKCGKRIKLLSVSKSVGKLQMPSLKTRLNATQTRYEISNPKLARM